MEAPPDGRPVHFNPDPPAKDYVPLAASALGMSILAGAAIEAGVLLGVRGLVAQAIPTDQPNPTHPAGLLLLLGTLGACATAVLSSWVVLSPLPLYRRGGLSILTAFAVVILALLFAPLNQFAGTAGLAAAALACGAGAWVLARRVALLRRSA